MRFASALIAAAASLTAVQAISSTCTTQIGVLALTDLGTCLKLTDLLPVLSGSGSVVPAVNTYLTSLCSSSTPTCSNSTLSSALISVQSGCSSDLSGGGTDAAEVLALESVLKSYPQFYAAACSKNSTTGSYCVTSTLYSVQNATGTNITVSLLSGLLSGTGSASSLGGADLCTGCVSYIYQEALSANATIAQTPVGSALSSQCGASFAQASGTTAPSGVNAATSKAASSSASSSSAAASTSKSAAEGLVAQPLKAMVPLVAGVGAIFGGVAIGGLAVL